MTKEQVKKIEKANEIACEILNDVKFKNKENEIKAIEAVSNYLIKKTI